MTARRNKFAGVAETAILRYLRRGEYAGTVPKLARLIGHPDKRTWLALVGLMGRTMVVAEKTPFGVRVRITPRGLAVGGF